MCGGSGTSLYSQPCLINCRSAISGQGARKNADVCLQQIRNGHRLQWSWSRWEVQISYPISMDWYGLVWIGMDYPLVN